MPPPLTQPPLIRSNISEDEFIDICDSQIHLGAARNSETHPSMCRMPMHRCLSDAHTQQACRSTKQQQYGIFQLFFYARECGTCSPGRVTLHGAVTQQLQKQRRITQYALKIHCEHDDQNDKKKDCSDFLSTVDAPKNDARHHRDVTYEHRSRRPLPGKALSSSCSSPPLLRSAWLGFVPEGRAANGGGHPAPSSRQTPRPPRQHRGSAAVAPCSKPFGPQSTSMRRKRGREAESKGGEKKKPSERARRRKLNCTWGANSIRE